MRRTSRFRQRTWKIAAALIFAVPVVGSALPASASPTEVFRFVDQFAVAGFRSTDPTGCVESTVLLSAGPDIDHEPPGAPTRTSGAFLRITQFDRCTSTFVFGSGFVSGVDYQSNPSVHEARLLATLPVRFSTPTGPMLVDVPVNMTWTGTGEVERFRNPIHFQFPDLIVNAQFFGKTREAVATGTVLVSGTNVTPGPSVSAEITHDVGDEVRIELP
jgi:hypothetical protein